MHRGGLALATVERAWEAESAPAGKLELTGRYSKVECVREGLYETHLRHGIVAADLGLLPGMSLDGEVSISDGLAAARVSASPSTLVFCFLFLGAASYFVVAALSGDQFALGLLAALAVAGYLAVMILKTRKAARLLGQDAIQTLSRYVETGRTDPWEDAGQ